VPQQDDFQLLELLRPKAKDSELQNPPKHHLPERQEHEASSVARQLPYSRIGPLTHASTSRGRAAYEIWVLVHPSPHRTALQDGCETAGRSHGDRP
jgi:hypothetical protein